MVYMIYYYDKLEDTMVKFKVDSTMWKTEKANQRYQSSSESSSEGQDTAIPYVEVLQLLRIVL